MTALSLSQVENFLSRNTVTSSRHVYDYDLAPGEQTVTGWEIAACLKHPFSALTLNKTRNEAFSLTTQVFGGNGRQTNVVADAFRHAALNILLSRNGVGFRSLKIMWTVDFATAHEKGANYHPGPSDMDLHNNLVGRNIYRAVTSPKKIKFLWSWIEVGVNGEPSNNRIIELLNPFVENAVYVEYQEDSDHDVYLGILDQVDVNTLVYISE